MTELLRLSVLDQSPVAEGSTGSQALQNTLDLARLTDRLGYHRYWVAEHHGGPSLAGPSPEVLIGPIASATSRLRVGSGGVMLPHYSPLKVAQSFSVLAALHPGRIDLGLGRAAGTDPLTTFALQRDRRQAAPDDFPQQLAELLAYLNDAIPADHPFARVSLPAPDRPEPWLLGSSPHPRTRSRRPPRRPGPAGRRPPAPSRGCSAPRRNPRSGPRRPGSTTPSPTSSTRRAPSSASPRRRAPSPSGRSPPTPRRRP